MPDNGSPADDFREHDLDTPLAEPLRVAISGAAGRVAYSLVFRIAAGGMFGAHQPIILRCLDRAESLEQLEALRWELFDAAFPLLVDFHATTEPDEAFRDADWIIMLASRTEHTPADHDMALQQNGPIYQAHGQAINRTAPRARVLVVATPSHTNCLIAMTNAPNLPPERWFALNRLYRMRATAIIAQKLGVPVWHLNRVSVWGNPGPNLYVDFHNSFVGDTPAWQRLKDRNWECGPLQESVGSRANQHFLLSGVTPAATCAQAILGTVRSVNVPTPYLRRFGAGVVSDGSYGVPRGLIFGFPLRTEDGRTRTIVQDIYHDSFAMERLQASVRELQHEAALATPFFGDTSPLQIT